MTHQEICLTRVLLGFALILAGLFPLCVVIFSVPTTLWVWGIGYAGCLIGTFLLLRQGHTGTHSSQESAVPKLEAQAMMLSNRLSTACPHVEPEDVAYIVWSVLKAVSPAYNTTESALQLHQRNNDCSRFTSGSPET